MRLRGRVKRKKVKGVYLLPNILTSVSLFFGFYSLVSTLNGQLTLAAWTIILAVLFDNLDGRMARATRSTSRFGLEYDSLADLVSFGVAPVILLYVWALKPFGKLGWLAAFLYLSSAALRLARFNVQLETVESKKFSGLPSPAAGCVVATLFLFYTSMGRGEPVHSAAILVLVFLLAFLMVSNVKYRSFKEANLLKRHPFSTLFTLVVLLVMVAAEPILFLFSLFFLYLVSGPVELCVSLGRRLVRKGKPRPIEDVSGTSGV